MAFSIFSFGMLCPRASATALRNRAFESGSPPPIREATAISLASFSNILPRFASAAPFLCLIVCHLLCPDIFSPRIRCWRRRSNADEHGSQDGAAELEDEEHDERREIEGAHDEPASERL